MTEPDATAAAAPADPHDEPCAACWIEATENADAVRMRRMVQRMNEAAATAAASQTSAAADLAALLDCRDSVRHAATAREAEQPEAALESTRPAKSLTHPVICSCRLSPSLFLSQHGRTALFLCCMRNDASCARWLVQLGADLNARDQWQQSAMLKAVIGGCTECVQLLLENGANTELVDTVSGKRSHSCLRSTSIDHQWSRQTPSPPLTRASMCARPPLMESISRVPPCARVW